MPGVDCSEQVKKHVKPSEQNKGGVLTKESPVHLSNVALLDPQDGFVAIGTKFRQWTDHLFQQTDQSTVGFPAPRPSKRGRIHKEGSSASLSALQLDYWTTCIVGPKEETETERHGFVPWLFFFYLPLTTYYL